jgi:dTDP-4-amino-4,6-dideoxygalactose transaminase
MPNIALPALPGNTQIPFNRPHMTGRELSYIAQAHSQGKLAGDGPFTTLCHEWLEKQTGAARALLTHSCTAALEMSALLMGIEPGDEVILPSFTFVSTANAFVLRGAKTVFVDIRPDTLNIDETLIEAAISPRTKAVVVVHYAGVACEMGSILSIAKKHGLFVVEDAAQGVMASYKGTPLGGLGDLGCFSFHETKNVIAGEGGALLVKDRSNALHAEIIREKGTNRSQFFRGEVDKYTWQDIGSSFLPGELTAAFLWAQLEEATSITNDRMVLWNTYHQMLEPLEASGALRRPVIPAECTHNAHLYYVLLAPELDRDAVLGALKAAGIHAVFHYVPLHSSPAGRKFCTAPATLPVTDDLSSRLVRLPMWIGLSKEQQSYIGECLSQIIS